MEKTIEALAALKIKGMTKTAMSKMSEDEIKALADEHLKPAPEPEADEPKVKQMGKLRPMSNTHKASIAKQHAKDAAGTKNAGGSRVGAAIMDRVAPTEVDEPE